MYVYRWCCDCSSFMGWSGLSFLFFVFKQKTAYEMRISDWSSDVRSSDLLPARLHHLAAKQLPRGRVDALVVLRIHDLPHTTTDDRGRARLTQRPVAELHDPVLDQDDVVPAQLEHAPVQREVVDRLREIGRAHV